MRPDNAVETAPGAAGRRRIPRAADLRRMGRAALLGPGGRAGRLPESIEHIAKVHRTRHPGADLAILRKAYVLAESSHRGQMRKSGEPYITHPLAVTLLLAELGAETTTLTASLLHDTVEDTEVTLDQVGEEFGEEVRFLVDGVTKLEKVDYGAAAEPETFRKMLVATGNDVRVMSIKLADRLHNMRTLGVMRPEKQARIAKVTRDVLIPLAERLGVQALKTELEDLVFAILHPEDYLRTTELILEHAALPDPLGAVAEDVRRVLREAGISSEVEVRPRHVVSVHRVRLKRGGALPGGSDFGRVLIQVAEDADCYAVLGELHTCFTPVIAEFKDFIAAPKFNLYQSLHTAIRDGEDASPKSSSAHGRCTTSPRPGSSRSATRTPPPRPRSATRASASTPRAPAGSPGCWSGSARPPTRTSSGAPCATSSPRTARSPSSPPTAAPWACPTVPPAPTPRTRCTARAPTPASGCVNGRLAPLGTVLRDGDTVHLLMTEGADGDADGYGPSPEWLEHARTPAARIAIARWLEAHPVATDEEEPAAPAVRAAATAARRAAEPLADTDPPGAAVRMARCCTPVPPDGITGFPIRGGTVAVHRSECPVAARMAASGRAQVAVHWRSDAPVTGHRATLYAEALGRPRLLADLTEVIATEGVAIVYAAVEPPQEHRVRHTYTVELPDPGALPALMRAMRAVPGVYDVYRAQEAVAAAQP